MQAHDPLQEIDLGDGLTKRPTYISANIPPDLKAKVVQLLLEFKDCFAWDYNEMPEIMSKIKEEIERLLRSKFIRTARYVEWLANIVPVIKKNGSLRVCIDFRDLNNATPKDEYPMPVPEMLIDSAAGFEYLSMLDGYSDYNQIFIAENDVPKTAFRCPGALGTYEWVVMPFGDFFGFVVHKKGIEINQNKTKAIMETKSPTTKKQLQSLLGKINFLRRFISNLSGKAQPFSPLLRLKKESTFTWGQDQLQAFDEIKSYLSKPPMLMPPIRNKFMKLYISASDSTLGSMLAQEDENGEERAIYYLSRPVDVFVYSHCDIIKHMLSKPILHSRIGKWALALTEYSVTYKPLKAVKGQIVADFIADHSALETLQNYVDLEPWKLYFDGSKHKHGVGIGILIISPSKIPTKFKYKINGFCSNNEAEYEALITGLEILLDLGAKNTLIRGDSELVLKQLTKEYKCIKEHLMKYFVIAISLLKRFDQVIFEHVPRIENQKANDLAQIASSYKISNEKLEELIEIKDKLIVDQPASMELSMPKLVGADVPQGNGQDTTYDCDENSEIFEIFAIDNLSDNDWRKQLVEYLRDPNGTTNRKIKYRALSYVIIGNELMKKTPEGVLLKCLSETEAYLAISDVHSGACGSHQAGHKMKWLLFRQGVYWPTILKDCIEFAKGCQECQRHSGIQHVTASELHSIVKPWPFRG
ncbi:hypothetical protein P8452_02668 [Trifolium repens]|nr:hypothetical protein P8452_02668 [Trifolium repens]